MSQIRLKRIYDPASADDGTRVLIDRLWPRGLKKEEAKIDLWLKEAAPSAELRRWFGHDPKKWEEFQKRYRGELAENHAALAPLHDLIDSGKVLTLLFAAKDARYNNAVELRDFIASPTRGKDKHPRSI